MKEIRRGDRVKFLNETGSGVVTRIIDKDLVMVSTEDGFEYPVLKSELLVSLRDGETLTATEETTIRNEESYSTDNVNFEPANKKSLDIAYEESIPKKTEVEKEVSVDKESKFYKKAIKLKEREQARREKLSVGVEEVDLHIEKIIDDYSDLTSGEIVEIQIARFKTSLEGAIISKQKRIIFIHGKGAGKLKRDIHRILSIEYPRCRLQDASFREYGYGATMVYIS